MKINEATYIDLVPHPGSYTRTPENATKLICEQRARTAVPTTSKAGEKTRKHPREKAGRPIRDTLREGKITTARGRRRGRRLPRSPGEEEASPSDPMERRSKTTVDGDDASPW